MNRDIYLNKSASIKACLKRIREKYSANPEFLEDLDRQEIILLNLNVSGCDSEGTLTP